jgi:membrane-associated phospholipid phosphatase
MFNYNTIILLEIYILLFIRIFLTKNKMNNANLQRLKTLPTLARTSPVSLTVIMMLYAMMIPSFNSFYLFILVLLTNGFNAFLKYAVMKPLYKLSGGNDLFLLGIGSRPSGASSCHFAIDGKKSSSFGMPSGHSQIAWTIASYLICRLIQRFIVNVNQTMKQNNNTSLASLILDGIWIFMSVGIILAAGIYISYSRVYIEGCHTIQQVSVGGIVGVILGFLAFYFEDDIKSAVLG